MERSFFLNKLSFAVFLCAAVVLYLGSFSKSFKNFDTTQVISNVKADATSVLDFYLEVKAITVRTLVPQSLVPLIASKTIPTNDLQCMAENIYYEAGNQSYAGKIAVGQVVLNRTKTNGYPSTVCGVIYEGSQNPQTLACQFSWSCAPHNAIDKNSNIWRESLKASTELLLNKGHMVDITEGATNYHADYIKDPVWTKQLHQVTKIDQHIFYKKI
jgi:spore germination cell wall hydrolase CwlJ-like protein